MSIVSRFDSKYILKKFFNLVSKSKNSEETIAQSRNKPLKSSQTTPFCQDFFQNTNIQAFTPVGSSVIYHGYLNGINHHLTNGGNLEGLGQTFMSLDVSPKEMIRITDFQFKLLPKTKEPIIAYRCIGEKTEFFKTDYARYVKSISVKKGDIITMPEYAYSTSDINYAKIYLPNNKGILYEIEYPANSRISIIGSGKNNEITAPRSSKYECLGVEQSGESTIIKLKYLLPLDFVT